MTVPKKNKELLGKGIRSLLQNIDTDLKATGDSLGTSGFEKNEVRVPLSKIDINPNQPRKDFDKEALQELASSIKLHDIIQPLTVAPAKNGRYLLIAGERRFKAAALAGLKDVPVYVREMKDSKLLELALLENLQREDLNAIEIGLSYKRLLDEMEYTQDQLAERMGKERSTVANYVRLLKLPPDIQVAVRNAVISMGHARALVNVDAVDKQLFIFSEIKDKGLSVRQTEDLVRKMYTGDRPINPTVKKGLSPAMKKIEDTLASTYSTKVKLNHTKSGGGSITFDYFSIEELNGLLDKLQITVQ